VCEQLAQSCVVHTTAVKSAVNLANSNMDGCIQMIQPATSKSSPDVRVVGQRPNVNDAAKQSKPMNAVVVPVTEPSEPAGLAVNGLPYRTLINCNADDDNVLTSTVQHAPVDHVTTQPRSHGIFSPRPAITASSQHTTSGQLINVTSSNARNATTRIQIGGPVDRNKHR